MKRIDLISLFPSSFFEPLNASILGRAQKKGLVSFSHSDLRHFGVGPHRSVDDSIYGGGPGMALTAPVLEAALGSVMAPGAHVVHLSPQGVQLDQAKCHTLAQKSHLILIAGHYEGVDQRFIDYHVDEEISIGDYVLTNGALASLVLIDAVVRLIPGVLGDSESARKDSFVDGLLDYPHYTRPLQYRGLSVPEVLLNGNHQEIALWRHAQALRHTQQRRPDLYFSYLARQSAENSVFENASGRLTVVRVCKKTNPLARFLKKLGIAVACEDLYQMHFKNGITLAKGEEKAYPILFIYTVHDKSAFERYYKLFMREQIPVGCVRSAGEQLEAAFLDQEGQPWVLIYSKREKDHGDESMG